ncbi:unnamed protein product, partial [Porites evermanni]
MKLVIALFALILLCALSASQILTPCPDQCVCEEQFFEESRGVGAKVNCSGRRLKKFPWPLPQLTTTLLLQNNRISRLEGWHLNNMVYLMELHLEGNRIKKIRQGSLGYLPSLHTLYLQDNRIEELAFGVFKNCSRLKTLNLARNKLPKLTYAAFDGLDQLETLDLSGNAISSLEDGTFVGLHRLQTLLLHSNQITNIGAYLFADVFSLTSLYLYKNRISVIEKDAFSRLLSLKILSLSDNKITRVPQRMVKGLKNLEELINSDTHCLQTLFLVFSCVSKETKRNILLQERMHYLLISTGDVSVSVSEVLLRGCEIVKLVLTFQKHSYHGFGQCPLVVMPLHRIDLLISQNSDGTLILSLSLSFPRYLHRNRINEIEPWTFTATKKLRQLYLYSNLLTFVPDNMFEELYSLRVLHLGINTITYIADDAFRDLGNLNLLYLDSNHLTLLNSKTFNGLRNLKDLHIFFNKISYVGKGTFDHLKSLSRLLWDVPEAYRQSMPPSNVVTKGSALHCDCNVRWLKEWLLDKNLGDITCASPAKVTGVSVTKLKEKHLVCEPLKVSVYPKKTLVLLGQNVQLHCESNTGATFSWMLNGTRLETDQYRVPNPLGTLTLKGLAEEDLGEYVCVAQSEAGFAASHAMVTAGVRPQFTTYPEPVDATVPQKPVVFKCQARGSPAPAIKWFKDDLLIVGTPEESRFHITMEGSLVFMGKRYHITREGSLVIFDPRVEDEGTYKCQAENPLGQVSYGVSLYVEMDDKCQRGCNKGGVCTAVQYECICTKGFYKKGDQCVEGR